MTGPVWLLVLLGGGVLWVVAWQMAEWLKDSRQVTAVTRDVRAVIAAMGRHNRNEADDRTEPFPALQHGMELMEAEFPSERPRDPYMVTVAELAARIAGEGHAVRLAWKEDDERRAADDVGGCAPGDFPTAVLPRIGQESSDTKES